jgi:hypothetical protein
MKDLFEYKDGKLHWKVSRGRQKAGSLAGATITDGYKQVSINKKRYLVHRIIFQMFHGYMPEFPLEIHTAAGLSCRNGTRASFFIGY